MDKVDPLFPNRPDHPDFWRLSEIVLRADGRVTEGGESVKDILSEVADFQSVRYMAENRVGLYLSKIVMGITDIEGMFVPAWLDGFLVGAEFGRKKNA